MGVPSWLRQEDLDKTPLQIPLADSRYNAPGWRMVARDFYTCVCPVGGPFVQPEALAFVHEFDPGVIPIWRKQAMLPPGKNAPDDVVVVSHLGIARHLVDYYGPQQLFYVEMPFEAKHPRPNFLEHMLVMPNTWDGGPDGVIPFDMEGAKLLWELYLDEMTTGVEAYDVHEREESERKEREALARAEEDAYKRRAIWKNVSPLVERMTMRDWEEGLAQRRRKPRQPYVFLGRSAL
jgi:hypothetical protein